MNVLVTFALETEFKPWRISHRFERISRGSYRSAIAGAHVRVVVTGMGQRAADASARVALAERPDICISSGLAGGLRPEYARGDVIAARAVRDDLTGRVLKSDADLFIASLCAGASGAEMFCTAQQMLVTAAAKGAMGQLAGVVDMESFSIMAEAARRNIPAVAVRAISDLSDEDLPVDLNGAVNARGGIQYPRLAARVLRNPQRLPAMMRLGKESRRASSLLARFLDLYISGLAEDWQAASFAPVAAVAL